MEVDLEKLGEFQLMITPDDMEEKKGDSLLRYGRWLAVQHSSCGKFEMFEYDDDRIIAGMNGPVLKKLTIANLVKMADAHNCD